MKDALSAIEYCHDRNICHCDLKPENFLLATPINTERNSNDPFPPIKIVDFGVSASVSIGQQATGIAGTIFYMAPEVFNESYGLECDMWSLGVILYILLTGHMPFGGNNVAEVVENIQSGIYDFRPSEWKHVSEDATLLMRQMLEVDTAERLTAREAVMNEWIHKKGETQSKSDRQARHSVINRIALLDNRQKYRKRFLHTIANELSTTMILEVRKRARGMDTESKSLLTMGDSLNKALSAVVHERKTALLQVTHEETGFPPCSLDKIPAAENLENKSIDNNPNAENEGVEPIISLLDEFNNDKNNGASGALNYEEFIDECLNTKDLHTKKLLGAVFDAGDATEAAFEMEGRGSFLSREIRRMFTTETSDSDTVNMQELFGQMVPGIDSEHNKFDSFRIRSRAE